jgi:hypothetical protein
MKIGVYTATADTVAPQKNTDGSEAFFTSKFHKAKMKPDTSTKSIAAIGITSGRITPRVPPVNPNYSATGVVRQVAFGEARAKAALWMLVVATSIAAVISGGGCGGDDGGGRGQPEQLPEITAEEYEKLVEVGEVPEKLTEEERAGRDEYRREGFLDGKGDSDSFEVYANYDQVDVVFSWPEGKADFWVKVFGEDGDELGDFDLDNGEIIQLLNGGRFEVEIYSRGGQGSWSATYEN